VVQFLRHLVRHLPGKLLVIWDGAPIHRGRPIKEFLSQGAAKRLRLEQLPGYAPDLNPDEGIWATSSVWSCATCAAPIYRISTITCAWPRPGSATSAPSFAVASPIAVTLFRPLPGEV
jgi:DDE superfamily endonuclease